MSPSTSPDGNDASGPARPDDNNPNAGIPRQKRLACLICRRRKLKCDGRRPSCSTCARLGHPCAYDEVRKKSGPKRGYVKALEERLKQVEVMLKSQDAGAANPAAADALHNFSASDAGPAAALSAAAGTAGTNGVSHSNDRLANGNSSSSAEFTIIDPSMDRWQFNAESPPRPGSMEDFNFSDHMTPDRNHNDDRRKNWEMIQLGIDEPLPNPEIIEELEQTYFEKIHPSLPMIHKARYYAAMNLAVNQRPPICLRYAMWMAACSVTENYDDKRDLFYQRARKYLEIDYMKGFGEHMISVAHCQTHIVLASYEFKMMYFPRAWMSTGQAIRLAQMIGLHRLDGAGLEVKQCIPPPRDWTEKEERRRTFWMAFCEDRYASIGTGWPMTVDERDISTILPSSEEAFDMSRPEPGVSLHEAMCPTGVGQLTPFAGIILMACLFGRNLTHLHRPDNDDKDNDLNGEFWKRHRNVDNILLNTQLGLPPQLKLPAGLHNPNIVFTNMCIHTSTICLHQAAIFKAEKNGLDAQVSPESKVRCINAANDIARIMRMVSHIDLSTMNPFISFCLYVAARVFVQYLKSRPDESPIADSLRFLLTAMSALKRKNPLTESFLVQLDVDLEALGERIPAMKAAFPMSTDSPASAVPSGPAARQGAVCEDGAVDGILSYQREFSKSTENNSSGADTGEDGSNSNMGRLSGSSPSGTGSNAANGAGTAVPTQQWLGQELPTRDRSTGHSPMFQVQQTSVYPDPSVNNILTGGGGPAMGFVDEIQDMSTSPSNRPTPNSSSASESRHNLAPPQNGQMRSGASSFDASPVSQPGGMVGGGQQQTAGVDPHISSFFGAGNGAGPTDYAAPAPSGSGAAAAMNGGADLSGMLGGDPASNEFMIAQGWNLPGQTAMTPVSEGVLRTIIQMGPMETMDLGWGSNQ